MFNTIKKVITAILYIACILFIVWVAISYINIISHNLDMNGYTYPDWNFFTLFVGQLFFVFLSARVSPSGEAFAIHHLLKN